MAQPDLLVVQYAGLVSGKTLSPPCAKVHMALSWKGLEYRTKNCNSPRDAKQFNPRGRVPVLLIDGQAVVDSSDILTELDRRFPAEPLLPAGSTARAQAHLLEDWADELLYFQLVYLRWYSDPGWARLAPAIFGRLPRPLRKLVPALVRRKVRARLEGQGTGLKPLEVVLREVGEGLDMLENLLGEDPFFCGTQACRGDLALAAVLDQLLLPLHPPETAIDLGSRPRLAAWLQRLHQRVPSFAG